MKRALLWSIFFEEPIFGEIKFDKINSTFFLEWIRKHFPHEENFVEFLFQTFLFSLVGNVPHPSIFRQKKLLNKIFNNFSTKFRGQNFRLKILLKFFS